MNILRLSALTLAAALLAHPLSAPLIAQTIQVNRDKPHHRHHRH